MWDHNLSNYSGSYSTRGVHAVIRAGVALGWLRLIVPPSKTSEPLLALSDRRIQPHLTPWGGPAESPNKEPSTMKASLVRLQSHQSGS